MLGLSDSWFTSPACFQATWQRDPTPLHLPDLLRRHHLFSHALCCPLCFFCRTQCSVTVVSASVQQPGVPCSTIPLHVTYCSNSAGAFFSLSLFPSHSPLPLVVTGMVLQPRFPWGDGSTGPTIFLLLFWLSSPLLGNGKAFPLSIWLIVKRLLVSNWAQWWPVRGSMWRVIWLHLKGHKGFPGKWYWWQNGISKRKGGIQKGNVLGRGNRSVRSLTLRRNGRRLVWVEGEKQRGDAKKPDCAGPLEARLEGVDFVLRAIG